MRPPSKSRAAHPPSPSRIVFFRPGAIGDTLLTFPALSALRARFPDARIVGVGNRSVLTLAGRVAVETSAGARPLVDQAEAFGALWVSDLFGDNPGPDARDHLAGVDLAIIWLHDPSVAAQLCRALEYAGVARTVALPSFPPEGSGIHVADHLLAGLEILGGRFEIRGWAFDLQSQIANLKSALVLHPGAGARRKRWSAERYAALADSFAGEEGWPVYLTCGPADEEAVAAVLAACRIARPAPLKDLDLPDLAAAIATARLFVGNDSGITHLAALLGVPTVALFGPQSPTYWAPIGPAVAILDAGATCSRRSGPRTGCPDCACLENLPVADVLSAARGLVYGRIRRQNASDPCATSRIG